VGAPEDATASLLLGLAVERPWLALDGCAISLLLCMTGHIKQSSDFVGPSFLTVKDFLSLHRWSLAKSRDY